jgi:putative SOS response-associated peptidase YedK
MCGRYTNAKDLSELGKLINFISRISFFAPRYNIAPRQQAPVIVLENFQPVMKLMRWGLIPAWAKDESIGDKLINARAETISDKASLGRVPFCFRESLLMLNGWLAI